MDNTYYVYTYSEPGSHEPFYCGKGKGRRSHDHLNPYNLKKNTRFYNKLKSLLDVGIQPDIDIIDSNLTNEQAIELEIELIRIHGRLDNGTGCLCNHTDGGEGNCGMSEEHKQKLSERMKGNTYSVGYKNALGSTNRFGMEHSIETRIKMSREYNNRTQEQKNKTKLLQRLAHNNPICSYALKNNEIIKIYLSITEVKKDRYSPNTIKKVLRGIYPSYDNMGWRHLTSEEKEQFINNQNK